MIIPAIVVVRVPDSTVIRLPLWRARVGRRLAAACIANDALINAVLVEAETAHVAGNPAAAVVAVRVLRACDGRLWPDWLAAHVLDRLSGHAPTPTPGGRHARAWTRWSEDAADFLRYRAVELLRGDAPARRPLFRTLADRLRAEGGEHGAYADSRALETAYRRVLTRCPAPDPGCSCYAPRYFPDVGTLHLLHAIDIATETNRGS